MYLKSSLPKSVLFLPNHEQKEERGGFERELFEGSIGHSFSKHLLGILYMPASRLGGQM